MGDMCVRLRCFSEVRDIMNEISEVFMVPGTGLEPVQEILPRDFKSLASTNSAIPAQVNF